MKASVGDRLVLASSVVGGVVRDGTVVEVRHPDGSPPYTVQWSDTGERTVVFPGPDAHVEAAGEPVATDPSAPGRATGPGEPTAGSGPTPPATTWRVQVTVSHRDAETTAQAMLVTGTPDHLGAAGHARRNPHDPAAPAIGEEIAVARALRQLADRLVDAAEEQIEDSTGRPARVHT